MASSPRARAAPTISIASDDPSTKASSPSPRARAGPTTSIASDDPSTKASSPRARASPTTSIASEDPKSKGTPKAKSIRLGSGRIAGDSPVPRAKARSLAAGSNPVPIRRSQQFSPPSSPRTRKDSPTRKTREDSPTRKAKDRSSSPQPERLSKTTSTISKDRSSSPQPEKLSKAQSVASKDRSGSPQPERLNKTLTAPPAFAGGYARNEVEIYDGEEQPILSKKCISRDTVIAMSTDDFAGEIEIHGGDGTADSDNEEKDFVPYGEMSSMMPMNMGSRLTDGEAASQTSAPLIQKVLSQEEAISMNIHVITLTGEAIGKFAVKSSDLVIQLKSDHLLSLCDDPDAAHWQIKLTTEKGILEDDLRWDDCIEVEDDVTVTFAVESKVPLHNNDIRKAVTDFCQGHKAKDEVVRMHGHISRWNTSKVTTMNKLFISRTNFNEDLSVWNVGSVTDMSHMFHGSVSFNGDLNAWDVSNVVTMQSMFAGAKTFDGDVSAWDVSKVKDMSLMFHDAKSFNSDLSEWNVSAVSDMRDLFQGAHAFNSNLSEWNVSSVKSMDHMFQGTRVFNGDLTKWKPACHPHGVTLYMLR